MSYRPDPQERHFIDLGDLTDRHRYATALQEERQRSNQLSEEAWAEENTAELSYLQKQVAEQGFEPAISQVVDVIVEEVPDLSHDQFAVRQIGWMPDLSEATRTKTGDRLRAVAGAVLLFTSKKDGILGNYPYHTDHCGENVSSAFYALGLSVEAAAGGISHQRLISADLNNPYDSYSGNVPRLYKHLSDNRYNQAVAGNNQDLDHMLSTGQAPILWNAVRDRRAPDTTPEDQARFATMSEREAVSEIRAHLAQHIADIAATPQVSSDRDYTAAVTQALLHQPGQGKTTYGDRLDGFVVLSDKQVHGELLRYRIFDMLQTDPTFMAALTPAQPSHG